MIKNKNMCAEKQKVSFDRADFFRDTISQTEEKMSILFKNSINNIVKILVKVNFFMKKLKKFINICEFVSPTAFQTIGDSHAKPNQQCRQN